MVGRYRTTAAFAVILIGFGVSGCGTEGASSRDKTSTDTATRAQLRDERLEVWDFRYAAVATAIDNGPQDGVFDEFTVLNLGSIVNNGWTSIRTAIEFDLSAIHNLKAVRRATLTFNGGGGTSEDAVRTLAVYSFPGSGTIALANFSNGDKVGSVSVGTGGHRLLEFDVTDAVRHLKVPAIGFTIAEDPANSFNGLVMIVEVRRDAPGEPLLRLEMQPHPARPSPAI